MIIKNASLDGILYDIYINDGKFSEILPAGTENALDGNIGEIIDASGAIVIPSFFNTHTHAAMTLLRGYADDMPLIPWLENKIWPAEAKLSPEDIYWGTRLACCEMIKSGTTFYNDMYWAVEASAEALRDSGMRGALSATFIDLAGNTDELIGKLGETYEWSRSFNCPGMLFTVAPHAIYTVSERMLRFSADFARERNLPIHTHLSETRKEYDDCLKNHGMKPAFYLDKLGLLTEKTVLAHSVWLDSDEIALIADRGASVSHNPISNMKLAVGKAFDFAAMKKYGVNVTIGTDGCSSNNNLSMPESMKFACLLQKFAYSDPELMTAEECFKAATENGAKAFGINAGRIEKGAEADMVIVKKGLPELLPGFSCASDVVYSAGNDFADTVICSGKVIMRGGIPEGMKEIEENALRISKKFRS